MIKELKTSKGEIINTTNLIIGGMINYYESVENYKYFNQ